MVRLATSKAFGLSLVTRNSGLQVFSLASTLALEVISAVITGESKLYR